MSESDRLVNAWARAFLTDGDPDAQVVDLTVFEDTRSIPGTGCDTCDYGSEEEPYGVRVSGEVDGKWVFKEFSGTMAALIDLLQTFRVMQQAGLNLV
jgi:hypothetical protein